MKTKIMSLLIAGLSLALFPLHAQITPGIKGGLNFSELSGFNGNNRVSGHVGFFFHHTMNRNWCLQPEILYSGEGQRYVSEGVERTLALNYIQVPLMVQYYPTRQFYIEAGPQFGLLANATDKGPSGDVNAKSDFTNAAAALNVGLGVNLNNRYTLYGRYSAGLTDVSKFDNIVDHSRTAQVGVSFRLH